MPSRILVSGAFGYVGGRVAQHLASRSSVELLLGTRRRVAKPRWLRRGRVVRLDVLDEKALRAACAGVDTVVHLAATDEAASLADPARAVAINLTGTVKLLQAAIHAGARRFIYVSTAQVYGKPLAGRITERTPAHPPNPYAITHRAAEDFVRAAHDRRALIGIVLRLSNAYGAPERADMDQWKLVANDFCRQAAGTREIVLRSTGQEWRDFVALGDVARAIAHCLGMSAARAGDGLFNLGGEMPVKIVELARLVAKRCAATLGYRPEVRVPTASAAPRRAKPDYRIDTLKATGFRLRADPAVEIDATLRLCRDTFASRR